MRKTLSLLLAFLLVFTVVPTSVAADEVEFLYTLYGEEAFVWGCEGTPRGDFVIPDTLDGHPVVHIEMGTFRNCTEIESVTLPAGVRHIMDETFAGCTALRRVEFPAELTEVCEGAFRGCISLEEVVFPEGMSFIGKEAFKDCRNLARVTLPENLHTIGAEAFGNCTSLTELTIPQGTIVSNAFKGSGLQKVTFSGFCFEIGEEAFAGLTLTAYYDPLEWPEEMLKPYGGTVEWVSAGLPEGVYKCGAVLYTLDGVEATVIGCTEWIYAALTIPATVDGYPVTTIGEEAFAGQEFITVNLPEGVTTIGPRAFKEAGFMHMHIPASVTSIGEEAFASCRFMSDVIFAGYVPDIAPDAFADTELTMTYYFGQWPAEARQSYGGTLTWRSQQHPGDVDDDGAVTSTDARLVLQYYANKIGRDSLDLLVADVDGDHIVTSTDARLILQWYAGKITAWPES